MKMENVCLPKDIIKTHTKCLTEKEKLQLDEQNKRLVSEFKAYKLEIDAQRNWDIFYKRNGTRFFKDRHWTTREFKELLGDCMESSNSCRQLLEVGCGVGNLVFPLIEEQLATNRKGDFYFYACDFSPRAIDFVLSNPLYNQERIKAFQCDITTQELHDHIAAETLDICTMIFVLSAIHPNKFAAVLQNLWRVLKPGGIILFRDYGLYDMAQLRFKPGHKISDNFYMRQDGTRCYYFADTELAQLFTDNGFNIISNAYLHHRTVNVKEGIDVPRIFLQSKFEKKQT